MSSIHSIRRVTNTFNLWREFPHRPSYDPDALIALQDLSDIGPAKSSPSTVALEENKQHSSQPSIVPPPFANKSIHLLMDWFTSGTGIKLEGELDKLAKILHPSFGFQAEELTNVSATDFGQTYSGWHR